MGVVGRLIVIMIWTYDVYLVHEYDVNEVYVLRLSESRVLIILQGNKIAKGVGDLSSKSERSQKYNTAFPQMT